MSLGKRPDDSSTREQKVDKFKETTQEELARALRDAVVNKKLKLTDTVVKDLDSDTPSREEWHKKALESLR